MTAPREHGISGYVMSKMYRPPESHGFMVEAHTAYSHHMKFHELTARVFRLSNLSEPLKFVANDDGGYLHQMIRAHAYVQSFLKEDLGRRNLDCTIIDGTTWADAKPTSEYHLDLCSINILWSGDTPIISVHIGLQKTIVGPTIHHQQSRGSGRVMMYEYHRMESPETSVGRLVESIRDAVTRLPMAAYGALYIRAIDECNDREIEYPVAAAAYRDGVIWYVPRPGRHDHIIHSDEYQFSKGGVKSHDLQGFLTNHGNFVTRYRGMYQAFLMRQVLGSEGMTMRTLRNTSKKFRPDEDKFSGILQENDHHPNGYLISDTALFSEDLW